MLAGVLESIIIAIDTVATTEGQALNRIIGADALVVLRINQLQMGSFEHPNEMLASASEWFFPFMDPRTKFRMSSIPPRKFEDEFA